MERNLALLQVFQISIDLKCQNCYLGEMVPKNLEDKIALILEDGDTLPRSKIIQKIVKLFEEENQFLHSDHLIEPYDLYEIKSNAISALSTANTDLFRNSYGVDEDSMRMWCYVDSMIMFLRSRGLINFRMFYKGRKK